MPIAHSVCTTSRSVRISAGGTSRSVSERRSANADSSTARATAPGGREGVVACGSGAEVARGSGAFGSKVGSKVVRTSSADASSASRTAAAARDVRSRTYARVASGNTSRGPPGSSNEPEPSDAFASGVASAASRASARSVACSRENFSRSPSEDAEISVHFFFPAPKIPFRFPPSSQSSSSSSPSSPPSPALFCPRTTSMSFALSLSSLRFATSAASGATPRHSAGSAPGHRRFGPPPTHDARTSSESHAPPPASSGSPSSAAAAANSGRHTDAHASNPNTPSSGVGGASAVRSPFFGRVLSPPRREETTIPRRPPHTGFDQRARQRAEGGWAPPAAAPAASRRRPPRGVASRTASATAGSPPPARFAAH